MKMNAQLPDGPIVLDDDRWGHYAQPQDAPVNLPRVAYAAAHVVMRSAYASVLHTVDSPAEPDEIVELIDWESTMNLRSRIAGYGFGIAESMDTAQRFSIGWPAAKRLIKQTGGLGLSAGFCAGASSDHLTGQQSLSQIVDGVLEQIEFIHKSGGVAVILPIPQLCALKLGESEYVDVYRNIIRNTQTGPLFVHWLGEMFLPSLKGYFPGDSFERVMEIDPAKVRGAKLSLLDDAREIDYRRRFIDRDQIMLTGDDFHFGSLIAGEGDGVVPSSRSTELMGRKVEIGNFSHALLGVVDAIARPASIALVQLQQGNRLVYDEIMEPCEKLGQVLFESPTGFYKSGLAFLSWLCGWQENRMLVNHEEVHRSSRHYNKLVRLANDAGVIEDAVGAAERLSQI